MKVEIEIESNGGNGEEDQKPAKPTPFQRKVAEMMAKRAGRNKPTPAELMKAAELESDLDEHGAKK